MKHIRRFRTDAEVQQADYIEPWLSYTENKGISYNDNTNYIEIPLTFDILTDGTITWKNSNSLPKTIEYKKNNDDWVSITPTAGGTITINVIHGDVLQFRGNNDSYAAAASFSVPKNSFGGTSTFNAKGNIMSLINSTSFNTLTSFNSTYVFAYLFENCTGIINANKLQLPALIGTQRCYYWMFKKCSNMLTPPKILMTTAAYYSHCQMFDGCSSLKVAPELYATTLDRYCYSGMFGDCTSLTKAPELIALTLVERCYNHTFDGCSNLNYIKAMFTTTPSESYTDSWLNNTAATGTFVKNAEATWTTTGIYGIPTGWTVQTAVA